MLPVVGFISRVRTSLKLKKNKTADGRLKRNGSFVLFQFYFTMCYGLKNCRFNTRTPEFT